MEEETISKRRTELNEPLIPILSRRHVFDLLQVRGSSRTRASRNTTSTGCRLPCPHPSRSTRSGNHSRPSPSGSSSSTIRTRRNGRRHAPHRPRRRRRAQRPKAQKGLRRAAPRQVHPRPLRRQIHPPKRTHRRARRGIWFPPRRRRGPLRLRHRVRRRRQLLRFPRQAASLAGRPPALGQDAGRLQQRRCAETALGVVLGPRSGAAAGGAGLRGERRAGGAAGQRRGREGVRRRRGAAVRRVRAGRADAGRRGTTRGRSGGAARGAD